MVGSESADYFMLRLGTPHPTWALTDDSNMIGIGNRDGVVSACSSWIATRSHGLGIGPIGGESGVFATARAGAALLSPRQTGALACGPESRRPIPTICRPPR